MRHLAMIGMEMAKHAEAHEIMHLPTHVRDALVQDHRRIVVIGGRGWIGLTLLDLLDEALDDKEMERRVVVFGSSDAHIVLSSGRVVVQQPLSQLIDLPKKPTMLFHLAFLTKDRASVMAEAEYAQANRDLSRQVADALDVIGADRIFVASSGAAALAEEKDAAPDLRLYGGLKREDEERFSAWATVAPDERRAIITRIYSLSGPHINKHDAYALANFLLSALKGEAIKVLAPMPVYRSYVAVHDLMALIIALMLQPEGEAVLCFSTGGTALELGELAERVSLLLPCSVLRAPVTSALENRYVGDDGVWRGLMQDQGIVPLELDEQIVETASFLKRTLVFSQGRS